MIKLVILTILFISSLNFGTINENLGKVMEDKKDLVIDNAITSEDVNKKQTEQKNNKQTTVNTSKPVENIQSSNNKTNQTQNNKNTTTQNSENKVTQSNTTPMPIPTPKPTVQFPKCEGNKHGIETGNSGRWFDTEQQAIALYEAEIKKWGDKWTNDEIDDNTYYKNCPYGYEDWTCPLCRKWTINLYYN